jgi:hypothetical protein
MDYKTFCENADIEYMLVAYVEGEQVGRVTGYTLESVTEQGHKLEHAISEHLTNEYYSRAEETMEQAEGLR